MLYKIKTLAEFNFIGVALRTTNANQQAMQDIPPFWAKFLAENLYAQIPNKIDTEVLGLYTDYAGDFTQPYSLLIGCRVSSLETLPVGMVAKTIPAAKYAVFTATGKFPDNMLSTWQTIWSSPLPWTHTTNFEVYGEKARDPLNSNVDIYMAIK